MVLWKSPVPLDEGTFVRREKRFTVYLQRPDGHQEAVHCANSGSMRSLLVPGARVWSSRSPNEARRRLASTLEWMELDDGLCCVNTRTANDVAGAFLRRCVAQGESPWAGLSVRSEVPFTQHTRFDFCLEGPKRKVWAEVKSVSLRLDEHTLAFPDAITTRGQKHLRELMQAVAQGDKAVLLFVLMRGSRISPRDRIASFRAAHEIDPAYAKLLKEARSNGVEVLVLAPQITLGKFAMGDVLPIEASS